MTTAEYQATRAAIIEAGFLEEVEWSEGIESPVSAEGLWRDYAFVVINSGMKAQVAWGIWEKVRPEVEGGGSALNVFRHPGKAMAIDDFWEARHSRFELFGEYVMKGPEELVAWCGRLSWIGPITKWHLAKNLGVECAKPDRWLERVAAAAGETVNELCERLARATGDRVATVDLVIWRACNLGIWVP